MDNPAKWWGNRRSRGGKFSFWCVGLCWRCLFFWRYLAGCNGSPLFARCLLPSLAGEGRDGGLCRYQHRAMPGVARRLLTFLASPRKVSKRRRPEVRRPGKSAGVPSVTRNDRPLRNSGSNGYCAKGFVCARPQIVLADYSCRFCVTQRLSSGPGQPTTTASNYLSFLTAFEMTRLTGCQSLALARCLEHKRATKADSTGV